MEKRTMQERWNVVAAFEEGLKAAPHTYGVGHLGFRSQMLWFEVTTLQKGSRMATLFSASDPSRRLE
jgi:hypothetical protein